MKKFYLILVLVFLVLGLLAFKKISRTFDKMDYHSREDEEL